MTERRGTSTGTSAARKENKKRPPSLVIPKVAKKRRSLVRRTHSPKAAPSPLSSPVRATKGSRTPPQSHQIEVRRIAPTLRGVSAGARVMANGKVLVLPTEATYMTCTCVDPLNIEMSSDSFREVKAVCSGGGINEPEAPSVLVRDASEVDRLVVFRRKAYALKGKDGNPSKPVYFHEGREVLRRLAGKYWPGPVAISVRISGDDPPNLPNEMFALFHNNRFLKFSNFSHPLTNRILQEIAGGKIVVGNPARRINKVSMTNASDVCNHLVSQWSEQKRSVHVLNGEERRELFSVPTCQYQKSNLLSLWIDEEKRAVHIRGRRDKDENTTIDKDLLAAISSPLDAAANRVVSAVLKRWTVIDERQH